MVASAIGERFGSGNQKSGQSFLEKIIQVPLSIPSAQQDALKEFCFELIGKAIDLNNVNLTEDENRRLTKEFSSNVLIKVSTPRSAIRYGNSISFSLPLLYKEVNTVDLLLVEALKNFYTKHYNFVKSNPEFFIGTYKELFNSGLDQEKVNSIKTHLDELGNDLTKKEKQAVQDLLEELFPKLNEAFHNNIYTSQNDDKWYKEKRIVSSKYFNRYFSYAVIKGEISDIAFHDFLSKVSSQSIEEVKDSIVLLIDQSSPDNFLIKLSTIDEVENWESSKKIISAICSDSNLFPKKEGSYFMGFESSYGQAAIFISDLIKKGGSNDDKFVFTSKLLVETEKFDFAYEIYYRLLSVYSDQEKVFSEVEFEGLAFILMDRVLRESGDTPVYEKFPEYVSFIFTTWTKKDKSGLNEYIKSILEKEPSKVTDIIKVYTPTAHSSNVKGPYKANFTKDQYKYFISIFDKEYTTSIIYKNYTQEEIDTEKVKWADFDDIQTDLNIIRQFLHWFNLDANGDLDKSE